MYFAPRSNTVHRSTWTGKCWKFYRITLQFMALRWGKTKHIGCWLRRNLVWKSTVISGFPRLANIYKNALIQNLWRLAGPTAMLLINFKGNVVTKNFINSMFSKTNQARILRSGLRIQLCSQPSRDRNPHCRLYVAETPENIRFVIITTSSSHL